jgi:Nucleotidyl transferase AbiEii toxin, Type IV TA system
VSTSIDDVLAHRNNGSWRRLEKLAAQIVEDANRRAGLDMAPKLGGGTRLMLALNHRISDDIDLFIRDPQWIGYLTPRLNETFSDVLQGYDEASGSLKLRAREGEIDFIVGMSLLGLPDEHSHDCTFALEPAAEVLAKKLFYRGWALTPRDLFDWWAVETKLTDEVPADKLATLLKSRLDELDRALKALEGSLSAQQVWTALRAPQLPPFKETLAWARGQVASMAS